MRVVDLFAGPGGWDVAANRLGFDPLGIEWDDAACATRRAAGFRTLQGDIAAMDPERFASVDISSQSLDGLLASPPCQAFSTAGKRKGRDDLPNIRRCSIQLRHGRDHRADYVWSDERAALVVEPLRWALALRPEWTCWEQVPPVLPYWELCATLLESVGYWTWTGLLHAETFGVPQTRKRAILIASRRGPVGPPAATHSRYYPRDKGRLDPGVQKWVSMAEALGWGMTQRPSMTVTAGGGKSGGAEPFGNAARQGMRRELAAGDWRLSPTLRPNATVRAGDEPAPTMAFGNERPRWVPESTRNLQRADWPFHRPATTIASGASGRVFQPGGHHTPGSQSQNAVRVTVQEAAVLQSFPADFPWQGTKTKQFEQVGNAIPPGLAQPVIEAAMAAGELAAAA